MEKMISNIVNKLKTKFNTYLKVFQDKTKVNDINEILRNNKVSVASETLTVTSINEIIMSMMVTNTKINLLEKYKSESNMKYIEVLAILNTMSAMNLKRNQLSLLLHDITLNLNIIEMSLIQYAKENNVSENLLQEALNLKIIPNINNEKEIRNDSKSSINKDITRNIK